MQFIQFVAANYRVSKAGREWRGFIARNEFIDESLFRVLTMHRTRPRMAPSRNESECRPAAAIRGFHRFKKFVHWVLII
ncbi:hypothetical protein [Burkholderia territorii]|uniref:hypothetical protein n=1 Tax=Burkholderia territorii TaxID=1503055 RepID=UPI000AE25DA9|nr:hypothetical protein [Burkholderia territorii]